MAHKMLKLHRIYIIGFAVLSCIFIFIIYRYWFSILLKLNVFASSPLSAFQRYALNDTTQKYKLKINRIDVGNENMYSYQVYPQMKAENSARVISHHCVDIATERTTSLKNQDGDSKDKMFAVVTDFVFYQHGKQERMFVSGSGGNDVQRRLLIARDMEVIHVLVRNLQHPLIQEIHLLVEDNRASDYIRHLWLPYSSKLVIKVLNHTVTMKDKLVYSGNCLRNRLVAISHQDALFGDGWEKIRPGILKEKKLMYALTRHSSKYTKCPNTQYSANCDPGSSYIGSHDVFFFFVKDKFMTEMLEPLSNITPNLYGMENVLIWFFRKKLGYTVLNPCPVLFIHHEHCVSIREKGRKRINNEETKHTAKYTYHLDH